MIHNLTTIFQKFTEIKIGVVALSSYEIQVKMAHKYESKTWHIGQCVADVKECAANELTELAANADLLAAEARYALARLYPPDRESIQIAKEILQTA